MTIKSAVRKLNGEEYVLCWLERNTSGGLLEFFINGSWGAQLRFVNLKDVINSPNHFRTFNIGREVSDSGWVHDMFVDELWEYTKTGKIETMSSHYRYIVADGRDMNLLLKLIDDEATLRGKEKDVFCFHSVDDLLHGASKCKKPKMIKIRNL